MSQSKVSKRVKMIIVYFMLAVGLTIVLGGQGFCAEKVIKWNVALWGGERDWTRPLKYWAEDMKKQTNGRWLINLSYGGVLSPPKEHLDGIKAGLFEAAQFCAAYAPNKTPLHLVFELPFILPDDNQQISEMMVALWEHPAVLKELDRWNAVPLFAGAITQYGLMGNTRIEKVEDFKGVRMRIDGEKARVLAQFGAVPTMIPAGDLYEAMERGTLDMDTHPWAFAFGSFRVHEISKYVITNFALGSMGCTYVCNKAAWNALPEEFKKIHMEWYRKAPKVWADEYRKGDEKWIKEYQKKLIFIRLPDVERAKMVEASDFVYKDWLKRMKDLGLPGQDVFDHFMAKRKEIAGF